MINTRAASQQVSLHDGMLQKIHKSVRYSEKWLTGFMCLRDFKIFRLQGKSRDCVNNAMEQLLSVIMLNTIYLANFLKKCLVQITFNWDYCINLDKTSVKNYILTFDETVAEKS